MGTIRSFRDLDAWNAAMDLVVATYQLSGSFPAFEQFGLRAQMQRAAASIPSNIAEGHAGGTGRRYRNYIRIAIGSLAELDTQLEIALRLKYIDLVRFQELAQRLTRVRQLLHGLHRSLRARLAARALGITILMLISSKLLLS